MGRPLEKLTLQAFLEWENSQETRNEFYCGEVFAMVGARRAHGRVVANLARHIGNALDGTSCQVFHEGMKVQVADDAILYPDVFVTCDPADLRTDMVFRAPKLVIEVLSPSTERVRPQREIRALSAPRVTRRICGDQARDAACQGLRPRSGWAFRAVRLERVGGAQARLHRFRYPDDGGFCRAGRRSLSLPRRAGACHGSSTMDPVVRRASRSRWASAAAARA